MAIGLTLWVSLFVLGSMAVVAQANRSDSTQQIAAQQVTQQTYIYTAVTLPIKANGSSMIYHLPTCSSYNATVIGNDPKDALFYDESQAVAAGFTKAENCP